MLFLQPFILKIGVDLWIYFIKKVFFLISNIQRGPIFLKFDYRIAHIIIGLTLKRLTKI